MPKNILDRLAALDTNSVSDALDRLGLPGATYGLRPLWNCNKIVGRACTIQLAPKTQARQEAHVISPVIERIDTADRVLVIAGGIDGVSCWGDILANAAEFKRLRGSIIDGMCRDIEGSEAIDYPVFGRGVTMISGRNRIMQVGTGVPVMMAGAPVRQDDYVIADRCGSVFIAPERIEDVIALAKKLLAQQDRMIDAITAGRSLAQLFNDKEFCELATCP